MLHGIIIGCSRAHQHARHVACYNDRLQQGAPACPSLHRADRSRSPQTGSRTCPSRTWCSMSSVRSARSTHSRSCPSSQSSAARSLLAGSTPCSRTCSCQADPIHCGMPLQRSTVSTEGVVLWCATGTKSSCTSVLSEHSSTAAVPCPDARGLGRFRSALTAALRQP